MDFEASRFSDQSRFWGTQFAMKYANFGWCNFIGPASFWDARFDGFVTFQGSQFNESADMTLAQFNNSVDFLGTRFAKQLYFYDVKFSSIRVSWSSFKDKIVCSGPIYMELINNFKKLEQFEDADSCYYQYRDWKRDNRPMGWPKIFDYLSWLSCGYGVRWTHPILSGLLVMIIFGLYFGSINIIKFISESLIKNKMSDFSMHYLRQKLKISMIFSAMVLLSLPSEWFPFEKKQYAKMAQQHLCCVTLERLIGWGLMLLLIGTISRLMVRY